MRYQNRWVMLYICFVGLTSLHFQAQDVKQKAAPSGEHTIRMVYLVPSDKTFRSEYRRQIKAAISNVQTWYQVQMGNEKTFRLSHPVIKVVHTNHTADWYVTNRVTGADFSLWFWYNALSDAFAATGADFFDANHRWVFYIDADPTCGQIIGAAAGVALIGANDLRGLTGQPNVPACSWEPPDAAGLCRWVGGLGHELGHTFGLPHPTPCPGGSGDASLLCLGYITYPRTYLLPEDKQILEESPFFSPQRLKKAAKPICELGAP